MYNCRPNFVVSSPSNKFDCEKGEDVVTWADDYVQSPMNRSKKPDQPSLPHRPLSLFGKRKFIPREDVNKVTELRLREPDHTASIKNKQRCMREESRKDRAVTTSVKSNIVTLEFLISLSKKSGTSIVEKAKEPVITIPENERKNTVARLKSERLLSTTTFLLTTKAKELIVTIPENERKTTIARLKNKRSLLYSASSLIT